MTWNAPDRAANGRRRVEKNAAVLNAAYLLQLCLVVAIAAAAGIYAQMALHERETTAAREEAEKAMAVVSTKIVQEMNEHALVAKAMAAAVSRDPEISQDDYQKLAGHIVRNDEDDIINVALAKGSTITHVFPLETNRQVIGTDLTLIHEQLPGLNLARRNLELSVTGPVRLVQGGRALIMRAPVLQSDAATGRERYWGVVSVVVDLEKMLDLEGISHAASGYDIAFRKIDAAGQPGRIVFGSGDVFGRDPVTTTFRFPFGVYELAAVPVAGWPSGAGGGGVIWTSIGAVVSVFSLLLYYVRHLSHQRDLARRRLLQAINSIPDGFVMYDENERLILCNDRYKEIYGFGEKICAPGTHRLELIKDALHRGVFPAAEGREEEWLAERLATTAKDGSETEHQMADGRWIRVGDSRMADGSVVGLRSDVTELKVARIRAEAASKAKSEFLSTVSHELRTPITSIMGGLGLALSGKLGELPAAVRPLLEIAHQNCERLVSLVGELLDFQKAEAGRLDLKLAEEDPVALVQLAIEANRSYASRLKVAYEFAPPEGFDRTIVVDRFRFQQVMDNLLSNAAKFSNAGGKVIVKLEASGEKVRISVRDFGRGIAPSDAVKVFEPFSQADSSDTREKGGTGLGLAICKRLVEGMHGAIGFHSAPGEGSEFFVEFPCKTASAIAPGQGSAPVPAEAEIGGPNRPVMARVG